MDPPGCAGGGCPGWVNKNLWGDQGVAISLSMVLLMGIILVVLIRGGSVKIGPALVAVLFGFFLASSSAAPDINDALDEITESISEIGT